MKHLQPGSAILTVILMMSAIIFCGFNLWKSTVLTTDLVLLRQAREQKMRATEGVLNYGIALCTKHFTSLLEHEKKNWSLNAGRWLVSNETTYVGQLTIQTKGEAIHLLASLLLDDACIFGMECVVAQKTEKTKEGERQHFVVRNWQARAV